MIPRLFLLVLPFAPLAVAQVQLHFASPAFGQLNTPYIYGNVVPVAANDTLVVGSGRISSAIGLYNPPVPHAQIALAAFGSAPYQSGVFPYQVPVLGGSGNDIPRAAAVDPSGNIWIAGNTDSDDFNLVNPLVAQKVPYRTAGFVIELDPTGTKLLFATYLAGQVQHPIFACGACLFASKVAALAVDSSGNIYVGGSTNETDFPTTPGAFMTQGGSIGADAYGETFVYSFVVKLSPAGKLVYSTLLGTGVSSCVGGSRCIGQQSTSATVNSMAVDGSGVVTVSGIKSGSYNLGFGYVWRLAADASKLLWATSVGGNYGGMTSLFMAQNSSMDVSLFGRYVTAIGPGSVTPPVAGPPGLFAAKLSKDGSTLIYSTDLGQSPDASAAGIALDASGNAYLAGTSSSAQFPVLAGVPNLGADFVLRLDATGAKAQSLFRFPLGTIGAPPVFDTRGQILLLGSNGAVLSLPPGYAFDTPAIVGFANAASYALNNGLVPGEVVSLFGFDLDGSSQTVQVSFNGVPATVLYTGPNQINVQVPFEFSQYVSPGPQIQVVLSSGSISLSPTPLTASPGLFTSDGVHAAVLNQDGSVNSAANPAARGSIVSLFGTGAVWPGGIQDGAIAASAVPLDQGQNQFELVDSHGTPGIILYLGTAPTLIYGVFQMNVQLPAGAVSPFTLRASGGLLASNSVEIYLR